MTASSCAKIDQIRITSGKLEELSPAGLRSMNAVIAVGIDNPSMKFRVSGLSGTIYYDGKALAEYSGDPITIERKSSGTHFIPLTATLADGVSILSIMSLGKNFDMSRITLDATAKVKAKGITKKIERKNIPLERLAGAIGL